ncbi:unnamed protein product, partial [marine sediment metagenome]
HEMLVKSINVGLAASTFNDMLNDREVPAQRERTAVEIWRKLVPSMAALAIEHRTDGPESIFDLNAMLMSTGLEPLPTPDTQPIDITPEKVAVSQEKSEGAAPPDAEA